MQREPLLERLRTASRWDVVVIGGGATGLGCAVDAAARGYSTLLLEAHDFAQGTSSRSTKLIHGGVRYLAQGRIGLVREALAERATLLDNAPHLVHPQRFVVPVYRQWDRLLLAAGLTAYGWLAGARSLGPSRLLSVDDTLAALPGTRHGIDTEGGALNENMYRLVGDWMAGTEVVTPARSLTAGPLEMGGHRFELLALDGHTEADLAILDRQTGVLFAGDLVFNDRAPTTPHANLPAWQNALGTLEKLPFKRLVPGHGPVARDAAPIRQTRAWLAWLDRRLRQAADEGLDMTEVLALPLPPEFRQLAVADAEFRRSVGQLYPAYEQQALR